MPTLDRFTAYSAAGGALAGAKSYPLVTAVGITVALELWENYRRCGRLPPDDASRFTTNVAAALGAWWLVRTAVAR
jgi:hypothetical protein